MTRVRMAVGVLLAALIAVVVPACQPASACPTGWGSRAKVDSHMSTAAIRKTSTATHACYDRLVIDLKPGARPGWSVTYRPVVQDQAGRPMRLRGKAYLDIVLYEPAYSTTGAATYDPANPAEAARTSGFKTFRQLAWGGSFEGYSTFGLGVRARLPFRVYTVNGSGGAKRIVIEVAASWN